MSNLKSVAIIGCGTIGCSFAALYLCNTQYTVDLYDPQPALEQLIHKILPDYTGKPWGNAIYNRLHIRPSLRAAVLSADIVHEAGPENLEFKLSLWAEIEKDAQPDAMFFSSTSGIPATQQCQRMQDPSRLIVCHPYNPPHIMPLIEIVPGTVTSHVTVQRALEFWRSVGRRPVVVQKECVGFVANRLAFALLREAVHLVQEGVVGIEDLDQIVTSSMGIRWSLAGPFQSYHAGGGPGGLQAFIKNIGGTVQDVWDDLGRPNIGKGEQWETDLGESCRSIYGTVDTASRDAKTRKVLEAVQSHPRIE